MKIQTPQEQMSLVNSVMIIEGNIPAEREEQIAAWQHLIDTGTIWPVSEGNRYSRGAMSLIEQGLCEGPVKA